MIIDSQPLTVAILAALLFGETLGIIGISGLVLGVIGLLLLEVTSEFTLSVLFFFLISDFYLSARTSQRPPKCVKIVWIS